MRHVLIMLTALGALALAAAPSAAYRDADTPPPGSLTVKVWLDEQNGAVYRPGEPVSIYFQVASDCYVVVYNVDTEGFVHVVYPKYDDPLWVQGGRIHRIPGSYDDYELVVDGPRGIEYVVAVASPLPLDLDALAPGGDYVGTSSYAYMGRITGDPHQAIFELNEQLAWGDATYSPVGYASDVGWFYVGRRVPYPRYMVYAWYPDRFFDPHWDPYVHVGFFVDFRWDHNWCRSWWWCHGCRPTYHYWYVDRYSGRRCRWKSHYHHDDDWTQHYRHKRIHWADRDRKGGWRVVKPARDDDRGLPGWRRVREVGRRVKGIVEREREQHRRSTRADSPELRRRDERRKGEPELRRREEKRQDEPERARPAEQERKRSERKDAGEKPRRERSGDTENKKKRGDREAGEKRTGERNSKRGR